MREKIDLPLNLSTCETLASPDRLIFSIFTHNEREGEISLFRYMDNTFICLEYTNNLPLDISSSCSSLFYNGLFPCLGQMETWVFIANS